MNSIAPFAAPTGRILLAWIFVLSGLQKISGYAGTQGYMEAMGVPGGLLPLVIAVEVLGGLAVMAGWKTRFAAVALAGFTVLSALLFHSNLADAGESIQFLKNLSIAGGFLLLAVHGPGAWSLDGRRKSARLRTRVPV